MLLATATLVPRVDILRQPARHRLRSFHVGHQQEKVCLRTVPFDRRQQQLDPQAPAFGLQIVGFIHHHQRERTIHLLVPNHQRQLLGRRDQDVERIVPIAEQLFLERVHLDRPVNCSTRSPIGSKSVLSRLVICADNARVGAT